MMIGSSLSNEPLDQSRVPFLESLVEEKEKGKISFHMPGHKGTFASHSKLIELLGSDPHPADLVELNYNIDYLHAPKGELIEAQNLAAAAYGADQTFFLINGSTVGNIASIMSVVAPGQKIIISRASHRSVYTGLILSGAKPIYIESDYHPEINFPLAVCPESVKNLLKEHPDVKAIHVTSPNYYGVMSNISSICKIAHAHGIPLLVDEAHGSHLKFHDALPESAVTLRADIIIQSTHKTQPALTQASMLHVNKNGLVDLSRVGEILSLLQSSSPNSILLASLDAARSQMALHGYDLLTKTIQSAKEAREKIQSIPGFWCYGNDLIGFGAISSFDPTKLIIRVSDAGYTGFEAFQILQNEYKIDAEFADVKHIICSMSISDTDISVNNLLSALKNMSINKGSNENFKFDRAPPLKGLPKMALSPRDAFSVFHAETVPLNQAVGRILIDSIIPYPPGVPLLVYGEIFEQRHLHYIHELIEAGSDFIGARDSTLTTIRVVHN